LRIDGIVVESNIHHPTDSALLGDGVRVISRLLSRARKVLPTEEIDRLGKEVLRTLKPQRQEHGSRAAQD
jgi:hypothetical protein